METVFVTGGSSTGTTRSAQAGVTGPRAGGGTSA